MTHKPMVGIGLLIDIDWMPIGGKIVTRTKIPAGKWLAWRGDPASGDLIVATATGRAGQTIHHDARHERFHDASVGRSLEINWNPPDKRSLAPVGILHAVRYRIPSGMDSNKSGSDWRHEFGEKHAGIIRPEEKWKPWLSRDGRGGLYIIRRVANDYELSDWLRG